MPPSIAYDQNGHALDVHVEGMVQRLIETSRLTVLEKIASLSIVATQSCKLLMHKPAARAILESALMQQLATLFGCNAVHRSESCPLLIVSGPGSAVLVEGAWNFMRGKKTVGCIGHSRNPKRDWPIIGQAMGQYGHTFTPIGHVETLHADGRWPRFFIHSPHLPVLSTLASVRTACERRARVRAVGRWSVIG